MSPAVVRRVALVTGGAIRVGRAISHELAAAGYRLAVNYKSSASAAEELVEELRGGGNEALAVAADVSSDADVDVMIDRVIEEFGRVDLLVNNAAVFSRRPFLELETERWRRTLEVNLTGPFLVARRVAAEMLRAGAGRIVNVCGTAGIHPLGDYAHYCAAKAGLDMLTRAMAEALAPDVQVNGIAPGTVLFPEDTDEEVRREVVSRIPHGRIGTPEDVARAVRLLAEAPDYVTGTIVTVDGGASLA